MSSAGETKPAKPPVPDTAELLAEIRSLRALLRVQSHKTLLMHRALAAHGILGPTEMDSPTAEAAAEVLHRTGSSDAILAFGSKGQGIFSPRPEMAGTLETLDVDCLFYRDFLQAWWCRGLLGLSHDIPSTAEYLRRRVAALGYRRITTTGISMCAYAAILFGVLIGAGRIVAFGPQTRVGRSSFDRFDGTDPQAVKFDFRSKYADLAQILDEVPYEGRIEIHFSRHSGFDEAHAKHLARFPQVSLHPVDSEEHNAAAVLKEQGRLAGLFRFD
ncbi:hypothetical protein SAMN02745194_01742 [Roseomonas rosea]|uniref:Uncharacterized protein n=1 Tax=Muricoccus roseus TaxID=198092 RepID=A0A1M6GGE6_9PROT|nr:hypothetical protein [Roseomonas rosea]SHJ08978.1 hypothetical protein SAMN02745194_01742 [Roseomonas rosea]